MPNWKRVITSGSDASLNTLNVANGITGSLLGTSSYATSASRADSVVLPGGGGGEILFNTGGVLSASNRIYISSNVLYTANGGTVSITGSLSGTATTASYSTTLGASLDSSTIGQLKLLNSDGAPINTFNFVTATTASYALTAQTLLGSVTSASYAVTASFAPTAGKISAAVSLFNYYNFT